MLTLTKRNHSRAVLRTLEVAAEARKQSIEFHFVFDGAVPPCKLATVSARRKRFGFKRTWNLQRDIIAGLKHDGFCYTVAPYEAEAQLVYMERSADDSVRGRRLTLTILHLACASCGGSCV